MQLHLQKILLLAINLICGGAVIFSYIYCLARNPQTGGALWGEVPKCLMPIYTASMFAAAAGYLLFSFYIIFKLDPDTAMVSGFGYWIFSLIYLLILVPSALWMPFTISMIENPSVVTWIIIRVVLTTVGIASICMLVSILRASPRSEGPSFILAITGCALFCIQTAVLDAIVWTGYFPVKY
jgi:hypothetical protein